MRTGLVCVSLLAFVGCGSDPANISPVVQNDAGADSASDVGGDSGACTPNAPPSGYSVVDKSKGTGDSDRGNNVAMAIDENGSPMIAYDADGGVGKQIWYTRWDRNCVGWTPPVLVDEAHDTTATPRGISIAYDRSTHTTGIAYVVRNGDLSSKRAYEVRYASVVPIATPAPVKSAPRDKVTKDAAPLRQAWTDTDPASPETAVIAVQGGVTWVAWEEPFSTGVTSYNEAVQWVKREGSAPWSSPVKIPTPGISNMQLGLVVDGGKHATLSYVVTNDTATTSTVTFHPLDGTAGPSTIMTGVATEGANVVLAIAGEEYVAAIYDHPAGWTTGKPSLFYAHLKGSTWNVVPLNAEKSEEWASMISIAATSDRVAIAAPIAGGSMPGMIGTPKYSLVNPKTDVATLKGPDATYFTGYLRWPGVQIDATKVTIGFGQPTNLGASDTLPPGIAYWREK
ncbi:MAG: hypothetical protein ACXVEF_37195 [Polyangiales bacterium]